MMASPSHLESSTSFVDLLTARAAEAPERLAYRFLADGEAETARLTYGDLDRMARGIAARLQELDAGGERVLLLYPPGLDFIGAFLGCLYAGAVAVPAYPPGRRRGNPRLQSILASARPRAILTTEASRERVREWMSDQRDIQVLAGSRTDSDGATAWRRPEVGLDTLAFLQYTSGSTAEPKGVRVSHGNLLFNERLIRDAFQLGPTSRVLGWLPLYHDMGLIGNVLQPLYSGGEAILMAPLAFLRKPYRWLRAISDFRADTSGGPNFAYDLCVDKISEELRQDLDLSSWRVAFNGAEPIRQETLERFAQAFGGCGFRRRAFLPCYGLAEATLLVSGRSRNRPVSRLRVDSAALERGRIVERDAAGSGARDLVASGPVAPELEAVVVDPQTSSGRGSGRIGEIWLSGPSVAGGYWDHPEATAEAFEGRLGDGRGPFLRTGDLGFLHRGELYITGRIKDLVIIRGRNHYPQDLELTAERGHPALRPGGSAAFSIDRGAERLVLVAEIDRHWRGDRAGIFDAVRRSIADQHQLQVYDLVLIREQTLPKTTSGKVRRRACCEQYLEGTLRVVEHSALEPGALETDVDVAIDRSTLDGLTAEQRRRELDGYLVQLAARSLGCSPKDVDFQRSLTALGLDSLNAMELKSRVEEDLEVDLPLADLLAGVSLEELRAAVIEALAAAPKQRPASVPQELRRQLEGPMTHGQQALWFLHRMTPQSGAYHLAVAAVLDPQPAAATVRRAFQALVDRHPLLRASFEARGGEPQLRIHPQMPVDFSLIDVQGAHEELVRRLCHEEAWRPMDLERDALLRVRLLERSPGGAILLLVLHHIVGDFWSLALLARELSEIFERDAPQLRLSPPELHPFDVAHLERELLAGAEGERLGRWWSATLGGELPVLALPADRPPADRPRSAARTARAGLRTVRLAGEAARRLEAHGRSDSATLFVTLLTAYYVLLHRVTGQEDLIVGSPTSGRARPEVAGLVGYLVNPVALRTRVARTATFRQLLGQVRRTVDQALEHAALPFAVLVEKLGGRRDASLSPVFQTFFTVHTPPPGAPPELAAFATGIPGARLRIGGTDFVSFALEPASSRFDLSLSTAPFGEELHFALEFNRDLFDPVTVHRLANQLVRLLGGLAAGPDRQITELPLLSAPQLHQVLVEWNDTALPAPPALSVDELVAARIRPAPDAVALTFDAGEASRTWSVSYRALDRRAAALAARLRELGVGPEDLVGVLLEPSPDLPAVLLGVLRAGGAYVPMDPSFPRERLAVMLEDARPSVVLTERARLRDLPRSAGPDAGDPPRVLCLEEVLPATGSPPDVPDLPPDPGGLRRADQLAYVIYTSGSTGRPKGVQITHRALLNFLASFVRRPGLGPEDVILASTTISFDIAGLELFLPLLTGARMALVARQTATDGGHLAEALDRLAVNVAQATPSSWKLLETAGWEARPGLKILCGGEALDADLAGRLLDPGGELWNLYGPTETTIWSAVCSLRAGDGLSIGRPIANTHLQIVDPGARPVPIGIAGELRIGGAGLARGYLRRPSLTAASFVPDSTVPTPGARLYRTGDLARWLADGRVDYLGRIDHQVKIRGARIELGEIETALRRLAGVREAVAVVRSDELGNQLVAYLTAADREPDAGGEPDEQGLREALRRLLPEVMVPGAFVKLDRFPLTPNGKVDRGRLPAPPRPAQGERLVAPRNPNEELVAGIWGEVLGVERVGVDDDFFTLAGHSLKAAQVVARLRTAVDVEIPVRDVFQFPTVASLARRVEERRGRQRRGQQRRGQVAGAATPRLEPHPRDQPGPLSFGQESLWRFDHLQPGCPAYNMTLRVRLDGRLDVAALERGLDAVEQRHEVLRTRFAVRAGKPEARTAPAVDRPLLVADLGALPAQRRGAAAGWIAERRARHPFDLARGPLFHRILLRLGSRESHLLVTAHHTVADGGSVELFLDELQSLYEAFAARRASPLGHLPVAYVDFAAWQRKALTPEALAEPLAFWRPQLAGLKPLELPTDRPRPAVRSFRGGTVLTELEDLGIQLPAFSRQHQVTPFMVLLAAFQTVLSRWSGADDVAVAAPFAQRDLPEVEPLIGFFVNTLVLRTSFSGRGRFSQVLERVREVTLDAWDHRRLPLERLLEQPEIGWHQGSEAGFQITFAEQVELAPASRGGLLWTPEEVANGGAKFDLSLLAIRRSETAGGSLRAALEYNLDLFDATTARRLVSHWRHLLGAVLVDPDHRIDGSPLLSTAERHQVHIEWNDTDGPSPWEDATVHGRVARQVATRPEAVAVTWETAAGPTGHLSFGELDRAAGRLADRLRDLGVGPDVPVAVLLERTPRWVVALLAVLRAGGAYVPIDPAYPAERITFMVEAARAPVLVTEGLPVPDEISAASGVHVVRLDLPAQPPSEPAGASLEVSGHGLAYVIFTSGSTGRPKGVALHHLGLLNLVAWHLREYRLDAASRTIHMAGLGFDASVWELWPSLVAGASIHLAPPGTASAAEPLPEWLARHRITQAFLATPLAEAMLSQSASRYPEDLVFETLLTGGDRLHATPARDLPFELVNHYGPTENTVVATAGRVEDRVGSGRAPTIGGPITNTRVYPLDRRGEITPIGVAGELHIAGLGLARGYLHRPGLTAARFIPKASLPAGDRLYRTGDLVRWRPGGELDFLGRIDHQVQIRGFRIELGEIESVLRQSPQVREAVVVAHGSEVNPATGRLVAYLTAKSKAAAGGDPSALDLEELRKWLRNRLPDYMLPVAYIPLESLPMTANGKVDRQRLPVPEESVTEAGHVAPRSALEEGLADIWSEVLGRERVGIHDDLFVLGGHSLQVTRMATRIQELFEVEISPRTLFEAPTIAEQAVEIARLLIKQSDSELVDEAFSEIESI